jgi:sugar porter (SP) family MFS transporter
MNASTRYVSRVALIAALGGFLMGFDASVISGVVGFIEPEFQLSKLELGWAVASLTLTSTIAMMLSGPLSDRFGRRPVLMAAALLFTLSAIASAFAPDYTTLVAARMLGGFGVGAALIMGPLYIAEISPPAIRGRLVSFNQLNIVLGISAAYFSNYLVLQLGQGDGALAHSLSTSAWRWMLGIETVPAVIYLLVLFAVPESPRWLLMRERVAQAREIFSRCVGATLADAQVQEVQQSLAREIGRTRAPLRELLRPGLRLVMTIGIVVAILQQITGINAVFFYAPMIFERSGIGTDASFMQAVLVGLVNLVFTVLAMSMIDRLGRRPLMMAGLALISLCMLLLAWGFSAAEPKPVVVLIGVLGFVAGFALSLGPVMWVLFSELFPNRVRGIAISACGLVNSSISFIVQLVFPWELEVLGSSTTFLVYGVFAVIGLVFVMRVLPETRGKSLEQLEKELVSPARG